MEEGKKSGRRKEEWKEEWKKERRKALDKDSKERVKENIQRRENGVKQRWSVRESRVRGIEKDGEKKK